MDNIEVIEFDKKVVIKYNIKVLYKQKDNNIFYDSIVIKVRFHKKEDYNLMIPLKTIFMSNISKRYGVKIKNIVIKYDNYKKIDKYKVNMIPSSIILDDKVWVRNIKIKELLNG
jgi:hypothetical protein